MKIYEFINKPSGAYGLGGTPFEEEDSIRFEEVDFEINSGTEVIFNGTSSPVTYPFVNNMKRLDTGETFNSFTLQPSEFLVLQPSNDPIGMLIPFPFYVTLNP